MKQRLFICLLLILGLFSFLIVQAQDAARTPEPGTRTDNECYTGGTMAGRCDRGFHADGSITSAEIEWAWRCGWYMARFNDGKIWREAVPSDCVSLLSGLPTPEPTTVIIITGTPTPLPTSCIVTFGGSYTECLTGNILSQDAGNDGSFEERWNVTASSIVGDGGACPTGTTYQSELGDYRITTPDFYNFMRSHGFKDTDDLCRLP